MEKEGKITQARIYCKSHRNANSAYRHVGTLTDNDMQNNKYLENEFIVRDEYNRCLAYIILYYDYFGLDVDKFKAKK